MSILTLPERDVVAPPKLEFGILSRTKLGKPVATGAHIDSILGLYEARFEGKPQASVFLYPSTVTLTNRVISKLDSRFAYVTYITSRKFDDISPEEVYDALLREISPLKSFIDHRYTFSGAQVYEHSFDLRARDYLKTSIQDLKVK